MRQWTFQLDLRKETTHRFAMGISIGIFFTIVPTVGIGLLLAVMMSVALNGNKLVAIAVSFLSNPLTFVPISYPSFLIGNFILVKTEYRFPWDIIPPENERWSEMFLRYLTFWQEIFLPIFIGSLLLGTVVALIAYPIGFYIIQWSRKRAS